jgi:hypothetical protein
MLLVVGLLCFVFVPVILSAIIQRRRDHQAKNTPVRLAKMESWQHTESEAYRY